MRQRLTTTKRWGITLTLLISAFFTGGSSICAENADFENSLPEGWEAVGTMTYYDRPKTGSYSIGNSAGSGWDTNRGNYIKTTKLDGDITLWLRSYKSGSTGYVVLFKLSDDGQTVGDKLVAFSSSSTTFAEKTYTLPEATRLAIVINYAHLDNMTYEEAVATEGPALTVKDGSQKLTSPYAYNFGLATAGTSKAFTLANPGTKDLTISVSKTGDFKATLSATTITAGGEVTLTVTMPETTGSSAVTITPAQGSGIDPFVINVSGTIRDANKVYLDFADGQMPEGWTSVGIGSYTSDTYAWKTNTGYVSTSASSSYYCQAFTSPKLTFAKDELIAFESAKYGSSSYSTPSITVEYSLDGSTWTAIGSAFTDDVYGTWTSRSVTIPVEGVKYIRFNGWYVYLRNIYGGEVPEEPNMKFTASDYAFGMISTATTTEAYTISNTGRATLENLSVTSSNENFVVTVADNATSIAAKGTATFTVTMKADAKGAQSGTITVKADGFDDVTFNVSGYVADPEAYTVSFDALPEGWENTGWSFGSGFATGAYTSSTTSRNSEMISPAITVAEGETLAIEAQGTSSYAELKVYTSTDNGATWTQAKDFSSDARANTSEFSVFEVDNVAAGSYKLKLEGYAVHVRTLNGYSLDQNAPAMSFNAADFAAGKVTANATKTYSVSNSGTGTLTVNIASDNEKFTVEPAQLVITDEAKEFTVTFNYEEGVYGKFNANITVTPTYDESAAVTFAASAQVVDPNIWAEDFEDDTLPIGWVANNWTIGTFSSYENTTTMALAPSGSTAGTLITPCLTAKEGDVLTWDAYYHYYDEAIKVEWSNDGSTWTEFINDKYTEGTSYSTTYHKEMSFTAPADGNYYLRFTSTYQNGVDNFNGFKLNLPDHIMAITASNIPTSGSYSPSMKATQSFNATVTVKESRGIDEENVVAKLYMGEEVIGTSEATTVEAGETKVITITATPTVAATEGAQMHIEVEWAGTTLTTEAVTRYVAEFVTLALTETEEKEITTGYSAVYDQVTLTRNFAEGWNTFVAPLSVSLSEFGEGVKAYTFTGYSDGTLNFSSVSGTSLNPATPYVIYIPEAIDNKVFVWNSPVIYSSYVGEEYIKTTKDGATFQGTYAPIAAPNMEGKWGVTDEGRIAQGSAAASIDGFRAYFELPATTSAPMLSIDGGPATPIDALRLNGMENGVYYDLNGRRVAQPSKGLYIINGKKVILK